MSKTVVGLFSTVAQAEKVKQQMVSEGYEGHQFTVHASDGKATGEGIGDRIKDFFSNLTGGDDNAHNHYAQGLNSGGALLTAKVDDDEAAEISQALKAHGARDIEGGYQSTVDAGTTVYGNKAGTLSGETAIPVIEEELVVGKREVDRGGVRVYSHLVERPVEEDVTLHEEHVSVERLPMNRAATAADFEAGQGGVIEINARGEEAVVGKNSRIVEEVRVGKQSSERTEAIHDTVRRTEVNIENLPAAGDKRNDRY